MKKTIAIILLVVLAGCSGAPEQTSSTPYDSATPTPATTPTVVETASPTASATPTDSPTPTATPLPEEAKNPWGKQIVTVAIVKEDSQNRSFRSEVQSALEFWTGNATRTTDFTVDYRIIDDPTAADLRITFVEDIERCGTESEEVIIGCAPYLTQVGEADGQTDVRIETGYDNQSTTTILKHELGHTLGLSHEDSDSVWFMAAKISAGTFPKPDVDERDWKWQQRTIKIYANVDAAAEHRHDKLRDEVQRMVWTYNDYEHENIPQNASLKLVATAEEAEVIVKVVDETPNGRYSDVNVWGVDPDEDGELEYYSNATIYIRDAYHDDVGDYAGYWMGYLLYADQNSDLPSPYRPENLEPH